MKIVKAAEPTDTVIIAEGETDGARLSMAYPEADIAIMPAGAKHFTPTYAEQLATYDRVLNGLDTDEAGSAGTDKIEALLPHAIRFPPPDNPDHDWCGVADGQWPTLPEVEEQEPTRILVSAGDLMTLEVPDQASWLEDGVLPIGGLAMLHGWAKSFKTFNAMAMLAALAQGQPWACFEPTEEPCRVAVMQFEIKWAFYRQRVEAMARAAHEPGLFNENFFTYSPLVRPRLIAGNTKEEDVILRELDAAAIQILLVDPVRRATGAIDMNAEDGVRRMLGFFERLNDNGITVVATHHDNKDGARAGGGSPLAMTGSGAWAGDPDTIVSVELPKGDKLTDSTRRNLIFTLRNGPAPSPRGMLLQEDGTPTYQREPYGSGFDADDEDAPAI
jgi:5S rRNA maturation endonuclease (ribonuclease M5)